MDAYLTGAAGQLLDRAKSLNARIPRTLPREFHALAATCRAEVQRVIDQLRAVLSDPAMLLPTNRPARLRGFRRAVEALDLVETVGFAALERSHPEDRRLNQLMDAIRLEIAYPLLPPVVTALSQSYFHIYPAFNLLCVPLAEGRFLLHLPDLYHEIAHTLLVEQNNPAVEAFQAAMYRALEAALLHVDAEASAEQGRRGPAHMQFAIDCWGRSWLHWAAEFFCDLFGAYTVGPAFAWSHLHLCAKRGGDPFEVPLRAAHSHPADAARMTVLLKGLARTGFSAEAGRVRDRWDEFTVVCGASREPEFVRCFPDRLLDTICDEALAGVRAIGCRVAGPATADPVYRLLNAAWGEFWRDPPGYVVWEQKAVDDLFKKFAT
jgi:hypothetical protein